MRLSVTSTAIGGAGARQTVATLPGWFPYAAGAIAVTAYLLTLSAQFSSDGMAFARLTRDDNLRAPLFFQAEHLLYPFVGWALAKLAGLLGYAGGPLPVLQALNAVAGGVSVGAFAWTMLRLAPERILGSSTMVLALAASYGWWYHSSDAEDQIIANAGILLAFAALVGARGPISAGALPTARGWLIVGGFSIAILVHATSVLFAPVAAYILLREHGFRAALPLGFVLAASIAVPYLYVGLVVHGLPDLNAWRSWVLAAPGQGVWGRVSPRNVTSGIQTLAAAAVYVPKGLGAASIRSGALAAVPVAVTTALMIVGIVAAVLMLRRNRSTVAVASVLWIVSFGLFGAYWAPDDFQFWLLILPPLYLLAALSLPERWCAAVVVPLTVWNIAAGVLPRHDPAQNAGLAAVRCLESRLSDNDLVIAPGWDWAGDYLPYFTNIETLSLNDVYVLSAKGNRDAFFAEVERRTAAVRARGGTSYVVRLDTLSPDDREFFKRVTALYPEDIPLRRAPAFDCAGERVSVVTQ